MAVEVCLRDVMESDLPVLFEFQREPDAVRMAAFPPRDREAFAAHWAKILADATVAKLAVVVDGRVAGSVGCFGPAGERKIGYWIGQEFWGRGIATRALAEFLRRVADRPLLAHVAKHNVASRRVLEKCGFAVVGENAAAAPTGGEPVAEWILVLDRR